jgi:Raf kinase inhibitor-like YbhB/YbcL family protein
MATHLIGRLLRPFRAGLDKTAWCHPATALAPHTITLTSPAFLVGEPIPKRHAGVGLGDNVSPPLKWSGVADDAVELVLVIEDPDVPLPRPIVHALVSGIAPRPNEIAQGALNHSAATDATAPALRLARTGIGPFRRVGYAGPRPIPGHGAHRYVFQLFAVDIRTGLDETASLPTALAAINGHVIARGQLTGTYQRD